MKKILTKEQEEAKNLILEWFLNTDNLSFVLAGYAGTGKTFLINYVVNEVLNLKAGEEAVFVTPTGKAATVLIKNGTVAGTVHSLIYTRDEDEFDVDENGEIIEGSQLVFRKKDKISEKIKLIIIDEASMIGEDVLKDLLSFNVKCLFCGDNAQLPPVNSTTNLLDNPNYILTEIVRQASDNPIIQIASMARKGQYIPFGNYGCNVSVVRRSQIYGELRERIFMSADQIICGRNKTRNDLNNELRRYKGIPADELLPVDGEKLICTLNNWDVPLDKYDRFHLVNGIIGFAKNIELGLDGIGTMEFKADFSEEKVEVPFDCGIFTDNMYFHSYGDKAIKYEDGTVAHENNIALIHKLKPVMEKTICRFEYAYAVTCHKAQGSEFDFVVVFDESRVFGEERNKWLYTAITRAREKLLIIR